MERESINVSTLTEGKPWRIFCAIHLPIKLRTQIESHIQTLQAGFPQTPASWGRVENFHLTLKFIGDTPRALVTQLSDAMMRVAESFEPFNLELREAGSFPTRGAPRVLWIGIKNSIELTHLQSRLEDECARAGFPKEKRPFHPHITIARLRKPEGARALAVAHQQLGFTPADFRVEELFVMRSEFSGAGAKHTVVSKHPLMTSPVQ